MSVAAFYRRVLAELAAAGVEVAINVVPNEMAEPIPFPEDTRHAAYDAAAATAFWRALVRVDRVFACSARASSARRARCTSSGAASTSR